MFRYLAGIFVLILEILAMTRPMLMIMGGMGILFGLLGFIMGSEYAWRVLLIGISFVAFRYIIDLIRGLIAIFIIKKVENMASED